MNESMIRTNTDMHRLTLVRLVENKDGIHKQVKEIGLIAEEPFVVLSVFLNKYFVQSYCGTELYPIGYCSFKYTIEIEDIGNRYLPRNICKPAFHDIASFENLNEDMILLAHIDKDTNIDKYREYINLLSGAKESISDLQLAIDTQNLVSITEMQIEDPDLYRDNIRSVINDYWSDNYKIASLIRFIYQYSIDELNSYNYDKYK